MYGTATTDTSTDMVIHCADATPKRSVIIFMLYAYMYDMAASEHKIFHFNTKELWRQDKSS